MGDWIERIERKKKSKRGESIMTDLAHQETLPFSPHLIFIFPSLVLFLFEPSLPAFFRAKPFRCKKNPARHF